MTWWRRLFTISFACVVAFIRPFVNGDSCIYTICGDYEYCCGYETCCFNAASIWYAWVIVSFVILACCICCVCLRRRRTAGQILVTHAAPEMPSTAVVVRTQHQNLHHSHGNYGSVGAPHPYHQPQYYNQAQQKYPGPPPVHQTGGYYEGRSEAPPAYAPPYNSEAGKAPTAPNWN